MSAIVRTIAYATVFVGIVLVYVPATVIERAGVGYPTAFGAAQFTGVLVGAIGAAIMLTCVGSFATIGEGTPAPFDPPRRLVVRGPYRFIRNPMYLGAALALSGAAAFYGSIALLYYAMALLIAAHLFVVFYEEPYLRRTFGDQYAAYCERVGRWLPRRRRA